ncbi:unnamed protein product [Somion occarium]|uniref:GST N-terminal domain-containing protein n=1 Tax=Somion occarium TaxID=3059160 RepID=A0ABP1CYG9_9APHY
MHPFLRFPLAPSLLCHQLTSNRSSQFLQTSFITSPKTRSAGTTSKGIGKTKDMSSSEPATKKQKTQEYVLYYWPGIPGRGEYVRLAFERSGTPYTEFNDGSKLLGILTNPKKVGHPTHFAPPALKLPSGRFISQTPAILNYLAPRLGLAGEKWVKISEKQKEGEKVEVGSEEYEGAEEERSTVNQLVLTALDLCNETHDVHHPVATEDYYEDQKDVSLRRAVSYRKNRLPKFLAHFERVLDCNPENKNGNTYLVGSRTTNADLVLFHVCTSLIPFVSGMISQPSRYRLSLV